MAFWPLFHWATIIWFSGLYPAFSLSNRFQRGGYNAFERAKLRAIRGENFFLRKGLGTSISVLLLPGYEYGNVIGGLLQPPNITQDKKSGLDKENIVLYTCRLEPRNVFENPKTFKADWVKFFRNIRS